MRYSIFKRLIALLLSSIIIFSASVTLIGCAMGAGSDIGGGASADSNEDFAGSDENQSDRETEDAGINDYRDKLIAPTYKEYPRDTVDFSDIEYERPDFSTVVSDFNTVIALVQENSVSFDEQIAAITALEEGYGDIMTMYSLANIYNSKNSSESFWNEEYAFITSNYPTFAGVVEDLFVAAANSPHAEAFESEYFGAGLIEEYKDGGTLTDTLIKLWADEQALESEYSSLSTATISVTYKGVTDTVDNIIESYYHQYGEGTSEYLAAYNLCMQSYTAKVDEISRDIFVKLIKIRRLIADELGYASYLTYAYESYGRDYSSAQMSKLLSDIATYVVPVYSVLSYYVFNSYFKTNLPTEETLDVIINETYSAISDVDSELADIYNYMLLYNLFDIELNEINRQEGAFTSYLDNYDAPFIFISAYGNTSDYSTLIHEFGHFTDAYINDNSSASIDQKEISSQGLEYLMLQNLSDYLSAKDMQYLTYDMLSGALETLIYQGFYAKFEELVYALPYDSITEENLNAAVVSAAQTFSLNTDYVNDISVVFIPHIFLYPFYVQSYCTSIIPSLELYFMEMDKEGSGFEAYKKIIDRTVSNLDFVETIKSAGLTSPFEDGIIRDISDKIFYIIVGSHYYEQDGDTQKDAA